MSDVTMNELKVIPLDDFNLLDLPGVRRQGPEQLREQRGLDMSLFSDGVFVDEVLGYAIARESLLRKISEAKHEPPFVNLRPQYYDNWTAEILLDEPSNVILSLRPDIPWYLENQQWPPRNRGSGVTVAVLDYGVAHHERLKYRNDNSDFYSCAGTQMPREDISPVYHGTRCAGVIAAADLETGRTSPAPDCDLVYACVARKEMTAPGVYRLTISLVDLLPALSWAVHVQNASIINMSLTVERLKPVDADALERVVRKIRKKSLALVFASAKPDGNEMAHPACIDGIIGVAEYKQFSAAAQTRMEIVSGTGSTWRKRELIFGPGVNVESVEIGGERTFNESSAACAYVSGIAVLYVERYRMTDKDLNSILSRMFRDAIELPGEAGGRQCLAVQLPK